MENPADHVMISKIRMREDLRARLEESAKSRGLSLMAEIVRRLELEMILDPSDG